MKIRLHPILIPLFILLLMTGNVSTYTFIFLSLLVHEAGHLIAAKWFGLRVSECVIMPYGGELSIAGRFAIRRKTRFYVAIAGPIATFLLFVCAVVLPLPEADFLMNIQLVLLGVNLLPFLPLDGGHVVSAILETEGRAYEARFALLIHSMTFFAITIFIFSFYLPSTLPYLLLSSFLLLQNVFAFRYRKYEKALLNLKRKKHSIDEKI